MSSVTSTHASRAGRGIAVALVAPLAVAAAAIAGPAAGAPVHPAPAAAFCAAPTAATGPDPFSIRLVPTARANGASGTVRLRFADSPFGVAVTRDGHHAYDAAFAVVDLPPVADAVLVAWAATPALDRVEKLGMLGPDGTLEARVHFNKFLIFVTAEPSADVDRWSGPILLRGISPSGRMHSMAGHGPFAGEPCGSWNSF
ncbi:MAG TPA: hypothetical protein VF212_03000 [Longimicrobiales bacterium]